MKADALFDALLPYFQTDIEKFQESYKRAQLKSFIIPYERVAELTGVSLTASLARCHCCDAKTEWLRVSRSMIRSYCDKHHPKPIKGV